MLKGSDGTFTLEKPAPNVRVLDGQEDTNLVRYFVVWTYLVSHPSMYLFHAKDVVSGVVFNRLTEVLESGSYIHEPNNHFILPVPPLLVSLSSF